MSFITVVVINTILISGLLLAYKSYKAKKIQTQQANSWPEVLDLIISSLWFSQIKLHKVRDLIQH